MRLVQSPGRSARPEGKGLLAKVNNTLRFPDRALHSKPYTARHDESVLCAFFVLSTLGFARQQPPPSDASLLLFGIGGTTLIAMSATEALKAA